MRICSKESDHEQMFQELKQMLTERGYLENIINAAIIKARGVPNQVALKPVLRQDTNTRPVFAVTYDPRLPSAKGIVNKHWRSMVSQDQHLEEVFKEPPMIAFKRQRYQRDMLIRAKVHQIKGREKRSFNGMRKCAACPYVPKTKTLKTYKKQTWKIMNSISCESKM